MDLEPTHGLLEIHFQVIIIRASEKDMEKCNGKMAHITKETGLAASKTDMVRCTLLARES